MPTRLVVCLVLVALASVCGRADEVRLVDGSVLVGSITRLDRGLLVMDTAFARGLSIPAEQIAGITTDNPWAVTIASASPVVARLVYRDGVQLITVADRDDLTLDPRSITALHHPPGDASVRSGGETAPLADQDESEPEQSPTDEASAPGQDADAVPEPTPDALWSGRLELGLNGSSGNTERLGFRGRGQLERTTDRDHLTLYIQGNFAREEGRRSANEILGGARGDITINDRLFLFGRGQLEFDEFENLDLRATTTGGFGYAVVKKPTQEWKLRLGLGFQHEKFGDGASNSSAIVEAGWDYFVDVSPWFRFTNSLKALPEADNPTRDYRLVVETALEIPLNDQSTWKLRAGMHNEYDAAPQPGVKRLDTSYFLNLVYEWK